MEEKHKVLEEVCKWLVYQGICYSIMLGLCQKIQANWKEEKGEVSE